MRIWTVAVVTAFCIGSLLTTAARADTITFGAGSAVSTADRVATFSTVFNGTNLNGYTEDGLTISVANIAYTDFDPDGGGSGFAGGFFYYGSGGNSSFVSISATDASRLQAIEFNVASGFASFPTPTYVHYEFLDNGFVTSSGSFTTLAGTVVGFSDVPNGFDTLLIGAYSSAAQAQSATATSFQAIALDNVRAELAISSGSVATPLPAAVWGGIALFGMVGGRSLLSRRKRAAAPTAV